MSTIDRFLAELRKEVKLAVDTELRRCHPKSLAVSTLAKRTLQGMDFVEDAINELREEGRVDKVAKLSRGRVLLSYVSTPAALRSDLI